MEKADKVGKDKQKKAGSIVGGKEGTQSGTEADAPLQKTPSPSNPANAEPEAIQDLEGLRRQLETSKQKAIEKRREYDLEPPTPPVPDAAPAPGLVVTPIVEEQNQQQAEPVPQPTQPASLVEQQQQQQGVIPIAVTELFSLSTAVLPSQVPLSASQSTISGEQQDLDGLQTTSISHPVGKEQSEMEKSLETIALTLSRHNSLNYPSSATASNAGVPNSVSMPAPSAAATLSEVGLAAVATSVPIVVNGQETPNVPAPLEEIDINTDSTPRPATMADTKDSIDTTAATKAEKIVFQVQVQGQINGISNTATTAAAADIVGSPPLAPSIEIQEVVPAESTTEFTTSLPVQLP